MNRKTLSLLLCAVFVGSIALAQESPSDWVKRILDPATIDVKLPPELSLNRKITVDSIRTDDPRKLIAIYSTPADRLDLVASDFEKILGVKPKAQEPGTPLARYEFNLEGKGKYPQKAEGLKIVIMKSPFLDGRAQVTMEIIPKK